MDVVTRKVVEPESETRAAETAPKRSASAARLTAMTYAAS